MSEFLAELIGTALLVILGDGVVGGVVLKKTKSENAGWIVITVGWGLAVMMAIYAVGRISGAHINPAVTLAFAFAGEFPWEKVGPYITAQMLGGFLGATIVWLHYLPHWGRANDPADQLAVFCTGPAIRSRWANLLSEIIGTFVLVGGLMFIGANKFAEGLNPLIIGGLILAIGVSLGGTTGYAINPARDFAPRLAHFLLPIKNKGNSDWAYAPVPVVGPLIGGVFGALMYDWMYNGQRSPILWVFLAVTLAVVALAFREYAQNRN